MRNNEIEWGRSLFTILISRGIKIKRVKVKRIIYFGFIFFICISFISVQSDNLVNECEMLEIAVKYEREGNLKKAIEIYQEIFDNTQKDIYKELSLENLGMIYEKQKEYEKAIEIYKKCLDLVKVPFKICNTKIRIAYCYFYQKKYSDGFQILEEIIQEYPSTTFSADAQFAKASIYHIIIKDYEKAINEYEKMIKYYPDDWRVKNSLVLTKIASCYLENKEYDKSIEIYKKISSEYKNTPFEKYADLMIEFVNEYIKKGKEVPLEIIQKRMREVGLGEGIVSEEVIDGKVIYKVK
ncbi:MAG TPA: tetratricopeptide repeat protein [bacterium]|nr:tetratricopeptide repeat protein [bacterium]